MKIKNSRLMIGAAVFGAALGSAGIAMAVSSDSSTTTTPPAVSSAPNAASPSTGDQGNTDPAHEAAETPEHEAEEASGNWHHGGHGDQGGHGDHGGMSNHDAAHEAAESPERAAEEAAEDAQASATGNTSPLTPGVTQA